MQLLKVGSSSNKQMLPVLQFSSINTNEAAPKRQREKDLISTLGTLHSSVERGTEAGNFKTVKPRYCHENHTGPLRICRSPLGRLSEARDESKRMNRSQQVTKAERVFQAEVRAWAKVQRSER